ncbi:translocation/assembly module TamB domain-containing protein [Thiomicrospira microaerophila]|uniref:translocation/assembly module TamB domain-containing protein n=1 Tax=Thiomicrospira microaerophila TaxID=406020 RepID=UPI002010459C|nr:translocation/assembly module TamB domain-containing protein [Thiomicrospira microaerophila]UQB42989.1 translocation/assembly module TamB domain-containing protein [Thiomicrospira microaerophila]
MTQTTNQAALINRLFRFVFRLTTGLLTLLLLTILTLTSLFIFHPKAPNYLWPHLPEWTDNKLSIGYSEGSLFSGLSLHQLNYQDEALELRIVQFDWRWNPLQWIYGDFQFKRLHIEQLDLNILATQDNEPQVFNWAELYSSLSSPFGFIDQLSYDLAIDQLTLEAINLKQSDQDLLSIDRLNTQLAWQAKQLKISQFQSEFTLNQQDYQAWLTLRSHFIDPQKFEGQFDLKLKGLDPFEQLAVQLNWFGSLDNLDFAVNSQTPYRVRSNHQLKLDEHGFHLESDWQEINADLSEELHVKIVDSQTIQSFNFSQQQGKTKVKLTSQVNDWPTNNLKLKTDYRLIDYFNYQLDFTIEDHGTLASHGKIKWPNSASNTLLTQPESFLIDLQTEQWNLGWLDSSFDYTLTSQIQWNLESYQQRISKINIKSFDLLGLPETLGLSGQINSQITSQDVYEIDVNLDRLAYAEQSGQIEGLMSINTSLDEFVIQQLNAQIGNNRLNLEGYLKQQDFLINIGTSLNQLQDLVGHHEIQGQAKAQASVHGKLTSERNELKQAWLDLNLNIPQMHYQGLMLNQLDLEANLPIHDLGWSQFKLELASLTQRAKDADSLAQADSLINYLSIQRTPKQLGLNTLLNLSSPYGHLALDTFEAQPSLDKLKVLINQFVIAQPNTGVWLLSETSQLNWQQETGLEISSICLALASHTSSQLCASVKDQQARWHFNQWPVVEWIHPVIPDNLSIKAKLDGQGQALWQNDLAIQQSISIETLNLNLIEQGYEWPLLIEQLQLSVDWQADQANLTTHAIVNQTGQLNARVHAFPNPEWSKAELDGHLRLTLDELNLSEQLTKQFDLHQTRLDWQTSIMGSIEAIQHNSRANLGLAFDIPLLELKQQRLDLQADIENDQITAFGRWQQPENRQAEVTLNLAPLGGEAALKLHLLTDSFELLKAPFAQVFTAANLTLEVNPDRTYLEGQLELHNSFLDLAKMPLHQRTSPSEDEIIMSRDGEILNEQQHESALEFNLSIGLGEQVKVSVLDAEAYLGGELRLIQTKQDRDMSAFGEVRLTSGFIQLERRNRVLIDGSSFSFSGNIANPQLNVNIFRVVERTTARLNITGTPSQPQFIFYANPPMSEGRIINMLIFGRTADLENEPNYESQILTAFYRFGIQNNSRALNRFTRALGVEDIYFDVQNNQVSNLLLGRSLTDNLYIRYAHDMSGQQNNAIQVFLKLHENWTIKSDNRDDRSSVDLIHQRQRK